MSTHTSLLLLITLWASAQDGLGFPTTSQLQDDAIHDTRTPRVRSRRCACNSLLDSECHYFCHLDIIWVNTPSKTTVYGLGEAPSRRRRSADRCACAAPDDLRCSDFCRGSPVIKSVRRRRLNIRPRKSDEPAPIDLLTLKMLETP